MGVEDHRRVAGYPTCQRKCGQIICNHEIGPSGTQACDRDAVLWMSPVDRLVPTRGERAQKARLTRELRGARPCGGAQVDELDVGRYGRPQARRDDVVLGLQKADLAIDTRVSCEITQRHHENPAHRVGS